MNIVHECPAKGKFIIVGSLPVACCRPNSNSSKIYDTAAEAVADVEAAGFVATLSIIA